MHASLSLSHPLPLSQTYTFFFVRHIDRLKVMLHTKLGRRECFRKKLMIKRFFLRLCVYSCVYIRNHHPLSGEKTIFNAMNDENIVRKPCMTNSEICIQCEMAEWRQREREKTREGGGKEKKSNPHKICPEISKNFLQVSRSFE